MSRKDVIEWKDALIARGLKTSTLNSSYLKCIKRLYSYAIENSIHESNPAKDVRASGGARAGQNMLPYEDVEIAKLLEIASNEAIATRRWVPWLTVLTGARAGEICQMWGSQIREIDGIMVIDITRSEDGGTLKPSAERTIPIHPALIEAGFLEFAKGRRGGPLFYDRPQRAGGEKLHKSKHVYGALGKWIRTKGFTDKRKSPSHAARHWFKSVASRVGMPDSIADAIQGHKDSKAASIYRHIDIGTLAEWIAKIPVPTVDDHQKTPPLENA